MYVAQKLSEALSLKSHLFNGVGKIQKLVAFSDIALLTVKRVQHALRSICSR